MKRFYNILKQIIISDLRVSFSYCPVCRKKTGFVRLKKDEIYIRCIHCRSSAVTSSIVQVLEEIALREDISVYEMSARGPLFRFLKKYYRQVTGSEYFVDVESGGFKDGVMCQDVQNLSFANESFDLCTSTDVFEHVPNDIEGFTQILRVLKPGGIFLFTVPLSLTEKTVERAKLLSNGEIKHLLQPEFHGDPISESDQILAFRNYGVDIIMRLETAGFSRAEIMMPKTARPWDVVRPVVVAFK